MVIGLVSGQSFAPSLFRKTAGFIRHEFDPKGVSFSCVIRHSFIDVSFEFYGTSIFNRT